MYLHLKGGRERPLFLKKQLSVFPVTSISWSVPGRIGAGAVADDLDVPGSIPGRKEMDLWWRHQRGDLLREVKRLRLQVLQQRQDFESESGRCQNLFLVDTKLSWALSGALLVDRL